MLPAKWLSISFSVVDVICGGFCYQGNKIELAAAKTTVCSQTRWRKDGNLRKKLVSCSQNKQHLNQPEVYQAQMWYPCSLSKG